MMGDEPAMASTDCLSCRLIGGGGFLAVSFYVLHYSSHARGSFGRTIYYAFGASLGYLGCARLMGMPPFSRPGYPARRKGT